MGLGKGVLGGIGVHLPPGNVPRAITAHGQGKRQQQKALARPQ